MFLIRRAQWEVFERAMKAKLVDDHVALVRATWSSECAGTSDREVRERVVAALEAASKRGFTEPADEARFLHQHFLWGADVEAQPWAT